MKIIKKMVKKPIKKLLFKKPVIISLLLCVGFALQYSQRYFEKPQEKNIEVSDLTNISASSLSYKDVPKYKGKPYIKLNNNKANFSKKELKKKSFISLGKLDELGRCTQATACLSLDTMPKEGEKRGSIGNVKPSGWCMKKYDCVEGKYVVNRTHMIGWFLSGLNDDERNLITGTRYMNIEMLNHEEKVAEYIEKTGNHVMYRITPLFKGNELMCRGLEMEAFSVEDNGEGLNFHVFYYNVQPGIKFNYKTGESEYSGVFLDRKSKTVNYKGK